jgi:hypothetical protein
MAPVKVFGPAMSTNVARVLVFLEEVGAEYEVVNIDFKVLEHKSPEHLARNVRGLSSIPCFISFLDLDYHFGVDPLFSCSHSDKSLLSRTGIFFSGVRLLYPFYSVI